MARSRVKGPDPKALLLVLLVALVALAGCTGGQDPAGPGPSDEEDGPSPETESESPAEELVPDEVEPGVQRLDELVLADGGALGYVYDHSSRKPLAGVQVVAQCIVADLDVPLTAKVTETDTAGRFEFAAGLGLSNCEDVTYQAVDVGYEQLEDAASGPLVPGTQYLVLIAMEAA